MDANRKKELKRQYKMTKPRMGVFVIRSRTSDKCHVQAAKDLRADINGAKMRLSGGYHPCLELQKEASELGADNFSIEILDELAYSPDESKTDYTEELEILRSMWEEKLSKDNLVFYKKRL